MSHLDNRRATLANRMLEMAAFLARTAEEVQASKGLVIHHLNMRLFLQVHVPNVVEASQNYDKEVLLSLVNKSAEAEKKGE